jgi:2-methylcitrate dehydratase PrpD
MSANVTREVAEFVAGLRYEQIPAGALTAAKHAILDSLGVALAGSQDAVGRIAAELALEDRAREEAALFGQGFRSSAMNAAFANGAATHAMDFDASFAIMGQPMSGLTATVFALAEPLRASGRRLLEGYVAGFEVTAKLAWSMPEAWSGTGWHATASIGSLGCTAAAARLLQLNAEQCARGLGIASSMASGSVGNFGTMSKPLHGGLAARNGVHAARLAQKGFTGSEVMLDGAGNGFHQTFVQGAAPDVELLGELGKKWDVERGMRYKAYPSGGLAHTAIDAALALRAQDGISPDAIERIDVRATKYTASRIVFGIPETELQAKFSMPYLVARALVDGAVTPDAFTDEAIREPAVVALARKVHMAPNPDLDDSPTGGRPCVLSIQMKDGRPLERRVDYPKGSPQVPLTDPEIEAKFRDCAQRVLPKEAAEQALHMTNGLESLDDVGRLSQLLMGDRRSA